MVTTVLLLSVQLMMFDNELLFVLLLVSSYEINSADAATASPIVELIQGKLKGFEETSSDGKLFYSFLGIPFAKSPVDILRFEEPQLSSSWDGVFSATEMPKMCLQLNMTEAIKGNSKISGFEDCLYLNVFSPKPISTDSNKPVMVFIHGGGFISGSASLYQPHFLLNEDIVLVVIQYRLGVFGFLSTGDATFPGNMGLKDQRMALQWVKDNIGRFGGNPNKVTIFGESSGGASVHLHMLSHGSAGLFNGLIAQSGNALCPWVISDQHHNYSRLFGHKLGCKFGDGPQGFKRCLQRKDGMTLLNTMLSLFKWGVNPKVMVPRVDNDFLVDHPEKLLKTGRYNKVNFMTGITRDEGAYFTMQAFVNPRAKKSLIDDFNTNAPYSLALENEPQSVNISKTIYDFYLKGKKIGDDSVDQITQMFGDNFIKISTDLLSLELAKDKDISLYTYELDHRGERSRLDSSNLGLPKHYISHVDDLFYLFSGGPLFGQPLTRKEDVELRRNITKLWTNFAKFGNPTPPNSFPFTWRRTTVTKFEHLSIQPRPEMKNYTRTEVLRFWKSLPTRQNKLLQAGPEEDSLVTKAFKKFINIF